MEHRYVLLKGNGRMSYSSHPPMYYLALLFRVWMILSLWLLTASEREKPAGVGIMSWQLHKAQTKALLQLGTSRLCRRQLAGMYEVGIFRSVYVCFGTKGGEIVPLQEAAPSQVVVDRSCLSQEVHGPQSALMRVWHMQCNLSFKPFFALVSSMRSTCLNTIIPK